MSGRIAAAKSPAPTITCRMGECDGSIAAAPEIAPQRSCAATVRDFGEEAGRRDQKGFLLNPVPHTLGELHEQQQILLSEA